MPPKAGTFLTEGKKEPFQKRESFGGRVCERNVSARGSGQGFTGISVGFKSILAMEGSLRHRTTINGKRNSRARKGAALERAEREESLGTPKSHG